MVYHGVALYSGSFGPLHPVGMVMRYVLSIQSSVAHGHVGNSAATFALQRMGRDVMRIDTVRFSNHPAHGGFAGGPAPEGEIDALIEGLAQRGLLAGVGAALSGYLGTAANGEAVARGESAMRSAKAPSLISASRHSTAQRAPEELRHRRTPRASRVAEPHPRGLRVA